MRGRWAGPNCGRSLLGLKITALLLFPAPSHGSCPGQGAQQEDAALQADLSCGHRGPPRGARPGPYRPPPEPMLYPQETLYTHEALA